MFKFLVDTCVWLDIAKDYQQQPLLDVIEQLIRQGELSLIVPPIILEEFNRNKERVAHESGKSLSTVFKRVKEMVTKFGDEGTKKIVLEQLNNLDHRIPLLGETAINAVGRISALLEAAPQHEISANVMMRAAHRALDRRAPFHRDHNSMNDAILVETYAESVKEKASSGIRFAFITHNTKDFSDQVGSDKNPHPDLANYFSKVKSLYFTRLAEAIRRVDPSLVSDLMLEAEWSEQPRKLTEILAAETEFYDKIWYNWHLTWRSSVEKGIEKPGPKLWTMALDVARKKEKKYGKKQLGPWSDFEWGMLNGKLSALRWVLGSEWDFLDT